MESAFGKKLDGISEGTGPHLVDPTLLLNELSNKAQRDMETQSSSEAADYMEAYYKVQLILSAGTRSEY